MPFPIFRAIIRLYRAYLSAKADGTVTTEEILALIDQGVADVLSSRG